MSNKYLIIKDYYKSLKSMYVDTMDYYTDFTMIKSNVIDDGIWNFLCNFKTKDYEAFKKQFQDSKKLFIDRIPRFYIIKTEPLAKFLDEMTKDYAIYCKDTWFVTNINQLSLNYKSSLNIKIKLCTNKDDIINTIMNGFSTGDSLDPYGNLSPTYRIALEQKLFKENSDYDVLHFAAYYNNEPISIVSITKHKNSNIAHLNNLTTLKQYKGQGVAKELLTFIIKELKKINIEIVIFATETGAYTEKYYIDLGFQIYEYGYCFEEK